MKLLDFLDICELEKKGLNMDMDWIQLFKVGVHNPLMPLQLMSSMARLLYRVSCTCIVGNPLKWFMSFYSTCNSVKKHPEI